MDDQLTLVAKSLKKNIFADVDIMSYFKFRGYIKELDTQKLAHLVLNHIIVAFLKILIMISIL